VLGDGVSAPSRGAEAALSDFRSDTVTRPSAAMREAMATAEVGDDVLDGDPTVRALEERVASWLGKERALFVPSGTMANQLAVGVWCRPGEELVAELDTHVVLYEAGALAALHGVQSVTLPGERGLYTPEALSSVVRPAYVHCPRTALVCLEQTHMGAGGRVLPLAGVEAVAEVAHAADARLHIDGARLAHAEAASGRPAAEWVRAADSVSVCFSKGLGAPVGSAVAGSAEFVERALPLRKRLGGWMRQAGVIAAPALLALEHNRARLAEDHARAQRLAALLDRVPGLQSPAKDVETNIVIVRVELCDRDAYSLAQELEALGVRAMPLTPSALRFVTHLDVDEQDLERLGAVLEELFGASA